MPESVAAVLPQILILVGFVAVFYFLLIRPQQKQQKQVREMLANIKVGDRIKTIGGIYGRITKIKDDILTIEVGSQKSELVIDRSAVSTVESVDAENQM